MSVIAGKIMEEFRDFAFCIMCFAVGFSAGKYAEQSRYETEMTHRMVVSMPMDAMTAAATMSMIADAVEKAKVQK